jgi:hypothetical protein
MQTKLHALYAHAKKDILFEDALGNQKRLSVPGRFPEHAQNPEKNPSQTMSE